MMTNEQTLDFLQKKKEILIMMLNDSKKSSDILSMYEDAPMLFFGDNETHSSVIEEIQEYIPWIDLKIEELTDIIENTN
jgi:hypothetical protein